MSEWISDFQRWLTIDESFQNAQLVVNHFSNTDWTPEALSAMLGNMRHESSVNPNMYEYGFTWEENRGFGLVQWTPRSKYWDWAISRGLEPRNGYSQLARIDYEVENNIQWIADGHRRRYSLESKYDITFKEFRTNSNGYSVDELTEAFMWNYEGPNYQKGLESLTTRQAFTHLCITSLEFGQGGGVKPPSTPQNQKDLMHLLLSGVLNNWNIK